MSESRYFVKKNKKIDMIRKRKTRARILPAFLNFFRRIFQEFEEESPCFGGVSLPRNGSQISKISGTEVFVIFAQGKTITFARSKNTWEWGGDCSG